MAFLKRKRIGGGTYLYIVHSYRRQGKVREKILEYLGRDPDPKRLQRALAYWNVKKMPKGCRRGRGR